MNNPFSKGVVQKLKFNHFPFLSHIATWWLSCLLWGIFETLNCNLSFPLNRVYWILRDHKLMVKSAGSAVLVQAEDSSPPEKSASPTLDGVNTSGVWHWTVIITASSSDIYLSLQFLQQVNRRYIFFFWYWREGKLRVRDQKYASWSSYTDGGTQKRAQVSESLSGTLKPLSPHQVQE